MSKAYDTFQSLQVLRALTFTTLLLECWCQRLQHILCNKHPRGTITIIDSFANQWGLQTFIIWPHFHRMYVYINLIYEYKNSAFSPELCKCKHNTFSSVSFCYHSRSLKFVLVKKRVWLRQKGLNKRRISAWHLWLEWQRKGLWWTMWLVDTTCFWGQEYV